MLEVATSLTTDRRQKHCVGQLTLDQQNNADGFKHVDTEHVVGRAVMRKMELDS